MDKEIYQKDIEKNFVVRRSTASGILDTMEKNGMLMRIPSDFDARSKRIVLTDKFISKVEFLENLIEKFSQPETNGEYALDLLMIAKYFERIADHAVNIAEWVMFSITGQREGAE